MKFTIIISEKDTAGINIKKNLLKKHQTINDKAHVWINDKVELIKIKEETLYADNIDKKAEGDFIIFATRHQSEQKKPCFCVHTPGNWGDALFGGKARELCISYASLQGIAYKALKKYNNLEGFETYLEATHHGPLVTKKPSMFIEIGSSKEEWTNKTAGEIVAEALIEILNTNIEQKKSLIGIGGPHYCDNISKIIEKSDYVVGHVCPKYMLPYIDGEMLNMAVSRTYEKDPGIVLDWKGLGQHKKHVQDVLKKAKLGYKKLKELY